MSIRLSKEKGTISVEVLFAVNLILCIIVFTLFQCITVEVHFVPVEFVNLSMWYPPKVHTSVELFTPLSAPSTYYYHRQACWTIGFLQLNVIILCRYFCVSKSSIKFLRNSDFKKSQWTICFGCYTYTLN